MIDSEIFILPEKSTQSRGLIDNYFNYYSLNADVLYELGHTIPIVNVVKNNIGISITYRKTVLNAVARGDVCMIPLDDPKIFLAVIFILSGIRKSIFLKLFRNL